MGRSNSSLIYKFMDVALCFMDRLLHFELHGCFIFYRFCVLMDLTARFQQITTELLCRMSIAIGFTGWLKKKLLKFKLSVFTGRMFLP